MIRLLVNLHRWIGVALCLLFAAWFATGVVMLYVPFPSLPAAERIENAQTIDLTADLTLQESLAITGIDSVERIRLVSNQQRPLLIVEGSDNTAVAGYSDAPELLNGLTADAAEDIVESFANFSVRSVEGPMNYDQWIVHQQFDRYRPFFRVSLSDSEGTQLYVSAVSGDVMQRTTRSQRMWNYVGAVIHWIYPTIIRKDWGLWDQLVWWLALVGIIAVIAGIVLGIKRLQDGWEKGQAGLASPFKGWMRWHHQLGILFSAVVLSWIFSGWLSMDHGRLFSVPDPTAEQISRFRGIELAEALQRIPDNLLQQIAEAKEIEISAIDEQAVLIVRNSDSTQTLLIDENSRATQGIPESIVESAIYKAWSGTSIVESYQVAAGDTYIDLREGSLGPNIMRIVLDDENSTWIHVDLDSGRIASVMDSSRRTYRWLYNGLHSLDFPGLVNRRPLWDVVMILLMLGGLIFCITGAVVAYRRVMLTISN